MPRVYAHRGLSALAPENTLAAYRACADHGVTWFECDVDILKDGTAVMIHDSTLDRTTDHTGPVSDLTAADLARVDAGSWFGPEFAGEPIPTLAQTIDLMNEYQLNANIELKPVLLGGAAADQLVSEVVHQLDRLDRARSVIFSSFDPRLLARLRTQLARRRPNWRSRARASLHRTQPPLGFLFEAGKWAQLWLPIGAWVHASAMHPYDDDVTPAVVRRYRRAGFQVNVWTVNSVERARELAYWGVNGIFTDRAHEMPEAWLEL